ncbi:sulfite exporter TauE/SafE family protein [Endozoicomonas sp. SCSIO W0465]|uniref:sulfite exporter TauE/SafE family protein n=1 Tax=Endozoicomonas sp. SCSIO W0465 TaxID=2918516 RepID=UPI002075F160|nr:sulfite exporter TauE/SafE family protein [Endozoicomonas sp. SCSIO W0465]USE38878.1 sulfite exporter TauE/SafE family protein [Endozoicomonas sp. SCSIO W0465]
MEVTIASSAILITLGVLAGIINTLAGGGSNLTLPALMVMGMPADIANASNRVGIFLQSLTGAIGFKQHNRLETTEILPMMIPTLVGGLMGALTASFSPEWILKPMLLGAMVIMSLIMVLRPTLVVPPEGTVPLKVADSPKSRTGLTIAGFYGGFVQAGVGFILLAAVCGVLRYDLVRGNALKLVCTLAFTMVALIVFIARDQIAWIPALILSVGYITGAHFSVKFAIKAKSDTLKKLLLVMTICGCFSAMSF